MGHGVYNVDWPWRGWVIAIMHQRSVTSLAGIIIMSHVTQQINAEHSIALDRPSCQWLYSTLTIACCVKTNTEHNNLALHHCTRTHNKTAELSQRRPRDAPNIWVPWKVLRVLTTHPATFPEVCNGLLHRSILRMCVQKLKFVALPVPEIIRGTPKIWAVPVYTHAPFSPKFLIGFCSHGPSEYICQIWRL